MSSNGGLSPTHQPSRRRKREPTPTPTRSHLGPLTTTFTPPPHCTRVILACPTCDIAWKALSCNAQSGSEDDTACWPRATSYPSRSQTYLSGLGFYSPGTICPTGYTPACTAVSTRPGEPMTEAIATPGPLQNGGFQFPLVEGETAVGCCPTGFECAVYPGQGWQTCHQVATSTLMDMATCGNDGTATSLNPPAPLATDAKMIPKVDVYAPLIQINWQASDLPATRTAMATETQTTAGPLIVQETGPPPLVLPLLPTSTSTSSPNPAGTNKRLSGAAKAGIALSSVIIFFSILSLIFYLYLRKRKKHLLPPTRSTTTTTTRRLLDTPDPKHFSSSTAATGKIHTISAFSVPLTREEARIGEKKTYYPTSPTSPTFSSSNLHHTNSTSTRDGVLGGRAIDVFPLPPPTTPSPAFNRSTNISPMSPVRQHYQKHEHNGMLTPTTAATHAATRFSRNLGAEDSVLDMESPIDRSSPWKLKRVHSGRGRIVSVDSDEVWGGSSGGGGGGERRRSRSRDSRESVWGLASVEGR